MKTAQGHFLMHQIKISQKLQAVSNVGLVPNMSYPNNKNKNPLQNMDASNLWYHLWRKNILHSECPSKKWKTCFFWDHAYIYTVVHNTTYIHITYTYLGPLNWQGPDPPMFMGHVDGVLMQLMPLTPAGTLQEFEKCNICTQRLCKSCNLTWYFQFRQTSSIPQPLKLQTSGSRYVPQTGDKTGSMAPRNCRDV